MLHSLPGQKTDITQPISVYVLSAYEMFPYGGGGWWTLTHWSKSSHYRCLCIYIM